MSSGFRIYFAKMLRSRDFGSVGVDFSGRIPSGLNIKMPIRTTPISKYSSQVTSNGM
ncbi:MAG: hypothetical protein ABSD99_04330 [Candidatus Bathyarchaeia archaeon]